MGRIKLVHMQYRDEVKRTGKVPPINEMPHWFLRDYHLTDEQAREVENDE